MVNAEECKECLYYYKQMDRIAGKLAVHTRPACRKIHIEHEFGQYAFIDELDFCPLEVEKEECHCIICDKIYYVPKKKIKGLWFHACDECKSAIEYIKELKLRHDDT